MGSGWHWYVVALTMINILACLWLISWSSKQGDNEKAESETLDHVWDGDLRERNNPLPRWWLFLFIGTVVYSLGYLAYYPGLGNFSGVANWSQTGQYRTERQATDAIYEEKFRRLASLDFESIAYDPEGRAVGSRLFAAHCTACHGSDGRGATGYPNLTDNAWLSTGDRQYVMQTIRNGRQGVMPPFGPALGEDGVPNVVAYVKSLSGISHDAELAASGQLPYQMFCLACHGVSGEGMAAMGAPSLTDKDWLYGNSDAALTVSIAEGRVGVMPAHAAVLNEDETTVLAAYVLSLSQTAPTQTEQ